MNIPVVHIHGGEVSGHVDGVVRHAITKLAHIHFVTNDASRKRVIQMGENPRNVFNVGSPDIEFVAKVDPKRDGRVVNKSGMGPEIDVKKPFLAVLYHPVTTEKNNRGKTEMLLRAVDELNIPAVWFWPNSDAGTNEIAKAIRVYREQGKLKNNKIRFVTDLLPEDFVGLMRSASVLVGNSSAGIKEASYLGLPVVNVGTRQQGRLRGENVIDVGYSKDVIAKAVKKQLGRGRYEKSKVYFQPGTSDRIVKVLSKTRLFTQKNFYHA